MRKQKRNAGLKDHLLDVSRIQIELQTEIDYPKMLEITKASMIHFFNEYQLEWDDEKRLKFMKQAETYRIYDKETLGYFQIRENSDILYLYDIQILPPYRKKGIGRKIVNYVINVARERHCDKINLAVFKSSPAINLYQKSGFKIFEETEAVYRMEKLIM